MAPLLEVASDTLQYIGVMLKTPTPFSIERAKTYAFIGENGCGKTTLANIIERGWNIAKNRIIGDKKSLVVRSIEFHDIHSLTGCTDSYYQQRFEATMNEDIPTVRSIIEGKIPAERWDELCTQLSLRDILDKRINFLSSGELRKFLIINLFTEIPDILILDNPYIGLDEKSRTLLNTLIHQVAEKGTAVIMLLCNTMDIPDFTDHVLPMKDLTVLPMLDVAKSSLEQVRKEADKVFTTTFDLSTLPQHEPAPADYATTFQLNHCDVRYGKITVLKDVNWTVQRGEKWALLGENGSGKSTLLSLIHADNPQGYNNDIVLFDHQRGHGESIWDIKRNIAYISPEMHLYFKHGETVMRAISSGLHEWQGCFRRENEQEAALVMQWLTAFKMDHLAERRFPTLSNGEQRLVLLIRTFIRSASLLILDEPLHGLDQQRKRLVAELIAQRTTDPTLSLIYVTHYRHEIPACCTSVKQLVKI